LEEDAVQLLKQELFPLATVATPNISEIEALLCRTVRTSEEMQEAALDLCELGLEAVVVKGGSFSTPNSDDCLAYKNGKVKWLRQKRINTQNIHGTGCTFSSAITAFLARSFSLEEAVVLAKKYLTEALEAGARAKLGKGKGPVMHFYKTW
jgi:hydroxymethylpyrimidine/phosphomethylpyrimidine kinase